MRVLTLTIVLAILIIEASAATPRRGKKPPRNRAGEDGVAEPWGGDSDSWGGTAEEPAPVSETSDDGWPAPVEPSDNGGWGDATSGTGGWGDESSNTGGWPPDTADNGGQSPGTGSSPADLGCTCMSVLECGASLRAGVEGEESQENPCPTEGDVCCLVEGKEKPPVSDGGGDSPLNCGEARPVSPSITLSDTQARFGELPWTVLISSSQDINNHACAGTLVHPSAIVTAAHCINKALELSRISALVIRAGEWDLLDQGEEPLQYQERDSGEIIIHPEYKEGRVPHNIAIVTLTKPFDLADNINTICLPQSAYLDEVDSTNCVASGWGKDPQGNKNNILKKINVGVMDRKKCRDSLRTTSLGKYFVLDQTSICAGGEEGKDTCQGDGGGPLACPSKSTGAMTLIGVTSWGVKCGLSGIPGIYSDVLSHIKWINDTLASVKLYT